MTRISLVLVALLALPVLADDDLAGLWKAKQRFGPDGRGTVVVVRSGGAYTADMGGRVVAVRVGAGDGELSFELPDHQGTFRGKRDGQGAIVGHWYRPGTPVNGGFGPAVSASRVVLLPDGANRWRGSVEPHQDSFTLYLLLQKRDDTTFSALLRNPDRDLGTQFGVERLVRDGNALRLMGKRGGKELEVAPGAYDPDSDVITLRFPTRGGSYDFRREGDESAFYPRGKQPGRYAYRAPLARDDGWAVGTLDDAAIDRAAMERFVQRILDMPMDSPDAPQFHGLLLARHAKIVFEEYFHEHQRDQLHDLRSAGKSLTAIIAGAAMESGVPLKLSSRVYEVMNGGTMPADLDPQKQAMTLEDLLTMSAGFFCDDTNDDAPGNETTMWDQSEEHDFYRFLMRAPMATPPGQNSVYCSAVANLALGMVGRAAHENPMSLFDRLVGGPMKIRRYEWGLDPAGNPYGGGGPMLQLRDFAKLGQLLLNGGTWDGRRILSRDFAARAGSPLYHLRNIYYGYLWWVEDFPYKNRMVRSYSARGAGGQTVFVVPELDLVIATQAGGYASRKGAFAASNDLPAQTILPAVREPGDDPHAPVVERVYVSPYGPSKDGSRVSPKP